MNYHDCINYLEKEVGFASCPGLERIRELCDRMGNPERKLSVIHVAGTNGKGSAAAMLSSILKEAGYRTGTYTSPHLERYNERMLIDGAEITDEEFAEEITFVKGICDDIKKEGGDVPTLFEIVTGAAFHYFYRKKVDVLLLEVGLGGRFDATNVVTEPLLSLIMSISIDHTDFLGNSLEGIAMEKAGILKKGCPAVLYPQKEEVHSVVKQTAEEVGARLSIPEDVKITVEKQELSGTVLSVSCPRYAFSGLELPLLGGYQIKNCLAVLEACHVLNGRGLSVTEGQIRRGLEKTRWAGRMEICGKKPLVLLDGAHNIDGITRLAESMEAYFKEKKVTLILGVLGDKEYKKMAEKILPFAECAVLTEPESERKLDVFTLEKSIADFKGSIYLEKEIENACEKALEVTAEDGVILCCGSLYMIGAARTEFLKREKKN